MKYKITIEIVEPEQDYKVREVYMQIVDVLKLEEVIKAVNGQA